MAKIVLGPAPPTRRCCSRPTRRWSAFVETDQKIKHRDKEGRPVTYGELLEKADPKLAHMVAPAASRRAPERGARRDQAAARRRWPTPSSTR